MSASLGWVDYLVCCLLFVFSISIGVYFGFFASKKHRKRSDQNETKDILLGGRQMKPIPIACSLLATFFSAIALLGYPYEIYNYGIMFIFCAISFTLALIISAMLFVPVFYNLQIISSNQYLELRFSKINQVMGAVVFLIQQVVYIGIVIYVPALAIQIIVNINTWIVVVTVVVSCTIYTVLGGLKAVVWTDVFQLAIMFISMLLILIIGCISSGGITNVMAISFEQKRFQIEVSSDPRTRHSFLSFIFGMTIQLCGYYSTSQTMIQRAISVKSLKQAKLSYLLNLPGLYFLLLILVLCGLVIFSSLSGCDPLITGQIKKPDEIVPYFVSTYMLQYPGVGGIFVAGVLSGALSTMSSGLNSMAAVTLSDIIMLKYRNLSDTTASKVSKILVIIYGIITLLFAYLISLTSKLMEVTITLFGMMIGPIFGVFTLGIFFPVANTKGAICGHIISQIIVLWIGFSSYAYGIKHPKLSLNNFNCTGEGNFTQPTQHFITANGTHIKGIENLFAISYLWYGLIGWLIVLIIGLPISLITGSNDDRKIQAELISPIVRNFWRKYLIYNEKIETRNTNNITETKLEKLMEKDSVY